MRVPGNFLGGKVRPALKIGNSAIHVVPNVKVRMEARQSILPLSLHDLLRESFTFTCYLMAAFEVRRVEVL